MLLFFFLAASPSGHTIKDHETVSVYKLLNCREDFYMLMKLEASVSSRKCHQ